MVKMAPTAFGDDNARKIIEIDGKKYAVASSLADTIAALRVENERLARELTNAQTDAMNAGMRIDHAEKRALQAEAHCAELQADVTQRGDMLLESARARREAEATAAAVVGALRDLYIVVSMSAPESFRLSITPELDAASEALAAYHAEPVSQSKTDKRM